MDNNSVNQNNLQPTNISWDYPFSVYKFQWALNMFCLLKKGSTKYAATLFI